jgi:uncharacterized membrane protein SirB2
MIFSSREKLSWRILSNAHRVSGDRAGPEISPGEDALFWPILKQLHVALALLTAISFCLRAFWMLRRSPHLHAPWWRWLPHVVDTLLFATGLMMAIGLSISPFSRPWLAVKLLAIVVYIVIGSIALKRGRTRGARVVALVASLLVLVYIFAVAWRHDPWIGLR